MRITGWLLIAVVCGGFPRLTPHTSRGAESDWGGFRDGLSVGLALDADTVALGAELPAEVFFRYVPFLAGVRPDQVLYTRTRGETCDLVFRDVRTGREQVRPAYRAPIPPVLKRVRLLETGRHTREDRFLLLDCEGEPVPSGRYDVFVRYTNTGTVPGLVTRPGTPPAAETTWSGTVTSAPIGVTVLPGGPDTVSCRLPTAITIRIHPETGRLAWDWLPDSWRDVTVVRRPGHWLRVDIEMETTLVARTFPRVPADAPPEVRTAHLDRYGFPKRTFGWWPHAGWGRDEGVQVLGPRFREVAGPGRPVEVRVRTRLVQAPWRWAGCWDDHGLPALWEREMKAVWP